MTNATHTPGPWEVERNGRARLEISAPEDRCGGYLIAHMNPEAPCKEANAALIAAAPAMLEALANADEYVRRFGEETDAPEDSDCWAVLEAIQAAIAAAKGQANAQ